MSSSGRLSSRRVLVVGASSGIGRAFALEAATEGAELVLAARRRAALEDVVASVGGVAVPTDVTEPASCRSLAAVLREGPPVELVLCCAAMARLTPMADSDAQTWSEVLATNVVGLNQVIRTVAPELAPGAVVAVLSSDTVGAPRWYLGPYGVSKAAVDQAILSWRMERSELRFTRVTVGGTRPTDFADEFDPAQTMAALEAWVRHGLMQRRQMDTVELARTLLGILMTLVEHPDVALEDLRLRSPAPPATSVEELEF